MVLLYSFSIKEYVARIAGFEVAAHHYAGPVYEYGSAPENTFTLQIKAEVRKLG